MQESGGPPSRSTCAFCGRRADSQEHVIPRWLRNHVPEGSAVVPHRRGALHPTEYSHSWIAPNLDLKVGVVCRVCNQGWMNDVEESVREVLPLMIRGEPVQLDHDGQRAVATWATKTTMMFQYRRMPPREPPRPRREWIYERREPPPNTHIWAAIQNGSISAWYFSGLWSATRDSDGALVSGEVSTLILGRLVLQVLDHESIPELEIRARGREMDVQVWPASTLVRVWPPGASLQTRSLLPYATRFADEPLEWGEPAQLPDDRTFRNEVIRLGELIKDEPYLENLTFVGCLIIGPAVLLQWGPPGSESEFIDCRFSTLAGGPAGDPESMFWPLPGGVEPKTGCFLMRSCKFEGCEFERVGFSGAADVLDRMRHGG
jgi:hypothetical protein